MIKKFFKKIEKLRKILIKDLIKNNINFNPYIFFSILKKNEKNFKNEKNNFINYEDLKYFLYKENVIYDERALKIFFEFFQKNNILNLERFFKKYNKIGITI